MKVYNTLIKDPQRRIKYRKFTKDGYEHYHVGLWVDGTEEELRAVERVEYELHASFRNRIRKSHARDNGFSVTFWAWGTFEVKVSVYRKNDEKNTFDHTLEFDLPDDDGTNYVDVSTL